MATTYQNFSISTGKGKLYMKEKQPTEGYEEVIYGVNNDKKTYHKYFDSVKGIPKYFETKEVPYDGRTLKFLEVTLVDGNVNNKISVPLKNKGGYTEEARLLISAFNGYKIGEEVTLTTGKSTYKTKKGDEKQQLNIYVNYTNILNDAGKGQSTGYIPYTDVPKMTSKVVAGDTTWDSSEQTEFYYQKLTEISERFKGTTATPAPASPPPPPPPTATPKEAFKVPVNDLPF